MYGKVSIMGPNALPLSWPTILVIDMAVGELGVSWLIMYDDEND